MAVVRGDENRMSERERNEKWIKGMERLLEERDRPDIQRWRKVLQEEAKRAGRKEEAT